MLYYPRYETFKGCKQQSDIQGHRKPLELMPLDKPHTIFLLVFHCNYVPSCTVSEISLVYITQNLEDSVVTPTTAVFVWVPNAMLYNVLSTGKKTHKIAPSTWDFVTMPGEENSANS